jgi:hypothetical protein
VVGLSLADLLRIGRKRGCAVLRTIKSAGRSRGKQSRRRRIGVFLLLISRSTKEMP